MIDSLRTWLQEGGALSIELRVIASVAVILLLLLLRPIIVAITSRRTDDPAVLYRWRKVAEYLVLFVGVFLLGRIWLASSATLATYLGLLTAGLAIALQDPISNLFGWLFIVWRHPFEVGDRVEIGDVAGDVVDIRFFQFTVLEIRNWVAADQSTGRVVHIPNKQLFTTPLANFHKGFTYIWHEIAVTVTFESDWRRAKQVLLEIGSRHTSEFSEQAQERVRDAARRYMISYGKLTPIVYTRVVGYGIELTLRYLCDPRRRRVTEEIVWEEILETFAAEPTFEFAYETQRIFYRPAERRTFHAEADSDG